MTFHDCTTGPTSSGCLLKSVKKSAKSDNAVTHQRAKTQDRGTPRAKTHNKSTAPKPTQMVSSAKKNNVADVSSAKNQTSGSKNLRTPDALRSFLGTVRSQPCILYGLKIPAGCVRPQVGDVAYYRSRRSQSGGGCGCTVFCTVFSWFGTLETVIGDLACLGSRRSILKSETVQKHTLRRYLFRR